MGNERKEPQWHSYRVNFEELNKVMISTGNPDLVLDISSLKSMGYELETTATGPFDALANAYTTYCKEYLGMEKIPRIQQWVIRNNPEYIGNIVKKVPYQQSPEVRAILKEMEEYRKRIEEEAKKPKKLKLI